MEEDLYDEFVSVEKEKKRIANKKQILLPENFY